MEEFLPFFLIIFAAVFFSMLLTRLHLPWVVALVLAGVVLGPGGFAVLTINSTIEFLGELGLIFLMFMAGLEARLSSFSEFKHDVAFLAFINGLVPFMAGITIGFAFGLPIQETILLGIVFISSSIAVIIPSLETNNWLGSRLGKSLVSASIVIDIASLIALSVFLQSVNPTTQIPLPLLYTMVIGVVLILRWLLPKIQWFFSGFTLDSSNDLFQQELRVLFVVLIGTVIIFQLLGVHPIIAGFFVGFVLSGSIKSELLKGKLRVISYGLLIPIFFVVVGTKVDISALFNSNGAFILTLTLVLASMTAKFSSGYLGGRVSGFKKLESAIIGAGTMPHLSTALAVVFTGSDLGILSPTLVTAIITLSIVTTIISPILIRVFSKYFRARASKVHSLGD